MKKNSMGHVSIRNFLIRPDQGNVPDEEPSTSQQHAITPSLSVEDGRVSSLSSTRSGQHEQEHLAGEKEGDVVQSVMDRGVYGKLCPWAVCVLNHRGMNGYSPVIHAMFSSRRLLGTVFQPRRDALLRGAWQSVEVDALGELIVSGDDTGIVTVSRVDSLLSAAAEATAASRIMRDPCMHGECADDVYVTLDTALGFGVGQSKIAAVQWNPSNQNEIGLLQNKGRSVYVYDINRTQGDPCKVIKLLASGGESLKLFDRRSTQGQPYCAAVGLSDGTVALCDFRAGTQPVSMLRSMTGGAVTCLEGMDHGRLLLGGTHRDALKIWDVRKVSGNALNFGAVTNKHPLLHAIHMPNELGMIPGLIDESGYIPVCSPQSLHPDPDAYTRVAVHMACGWTSVLDVARLGMTHIHAPPVAQEGTYQRESAMTLDDAVNARIISDSGRVALPHEILRVEQSGHEALRRRQAERAKKMHGTWLSGSQFVVPSRSKDALFIIDFGVSSHSGTRIGCMKDDINSQIPSAVKIDVHVEPTCVVTAHHDGRESLLAFGMEGRCAVLQK